MRDLPPGMTMSLNLVGTELSLGPPRSPDSTGGDGETLSMLGLMTLRGFGETRDLGKAVELCRQAAVRGYARAETGPGRFYREGEPRPQDRVVAVRRFPLPPSTSHLVR